MPGSYFVSGIGTGVGKTFVSAVIAEHLKAHYWKPIQAGLDDGTDAAVISNLLGDPSRIIPERFLFKMPASPHLAAKAENIEINFGDFALPKIDAPLVVEGAGGLMVPLNEQGDLMIDLIAHLNLPVIVVVQPYLGAINHCLLSIEALRSRHIAIAGLVINGDDPLHNEAIICRITGLPVILRIATEAKICRDTVLNYAHQCNMK